MIGINNSSNPESNNSVRIHETAVVEKGANIGEGTAIWHHCHIRSSAQIGKRCNLGKNVFVDGEVVIGDGVKIQNNVSVYKGVTLEEDVFVGPSVVFTNDLRPRTFIWDNNRLATTLVKKGASIGANATIICGNRVIEEYALIGAGAVVTRNVPAYGLVLGNPARLVGYVCKCAQKLVKRGDELVCPDENCKFSVRILIKNLLEVQK